MTVLSDLAVPIVQAPLAGGPSTPQLAAAVSSVGAFGFLAAGYLSPDRLQQDITTLRGLTTSGFGVNVFVPSTEPADVGAVGEYAASLRADAERAEIALGVPRFDDDSFDDKIDVLCADPVAVVSFTFGLPAVDVVRRLRALNSEIWLTVTSPDEARAAASLEPDALVVQGIEAGGHRAVHRDDADAADLSLLVALQLIAREVDLPLVAAGGIGTGAAIAAVLAAGAAAAQLGTAYLRCPEAATSDVQRAVLGTSMPTVLTRAFTGRIARGIRNQFSVDHGATAPHAYPEVHHLTAPLRAHGRTHGDADVVNLWAGQSHRLATDLPAAELTRQLATEAQDAISDAARRLRLAAR